MKILYLVRHAKSSWKETTLDDLERPLNKRGRKNVPQMAQRLRQRGARADRVRLSSRAPSRNEAPSSRPPIVATLRGPSRS